MRETSASTPVLNSMTEDVTVSMPRETGGWPGAGIRVFSLSVVMSLYVCAGHTVRTLLLQPESVVSQSAELLPLREKKGLPH